MIEVLRPGILTTVQDLGRPGMGRFGVSPAGAMDPLALRVANRLCGNPDGAPALEITGPGTELRFAEETVFALAGGDLGAELDGHAVEEWRAHHAPAGAALHFKRRVRGARAVLAVAGGFDVPRVLGSASADLDAGLGGGRLAKGAQLRREYRKAGRREDPGGPDPDPQDLPAFPPSCIPLRSVYDDPSTLRFVPTSDPAISGESLALFTSTSFRVSERSNRTGYRLTGATLPVTPAADRLSAPIAPGTIQLPPDGQPILLMADRQTIGGYPVLGHLVAADRAKTAQLWPGDQVRFVAVSLEDAARATRLLADALEVL
jgi:antagonist of KipI